MRRHRSSAGVLVSLVLTAGLGVGVVGVGRGPSAGADPATGAPTEAARIPDRSHAYGSKRAREVVERREIGRSVQDRPIHAYRMGNPHARHTALLLGQMHGDEPAGPRTVRAIRDRLRVDSDVNLWIVPTMNPDGAERGTRKNARGVDLNRNWPTSGWAAADRMASSSTYRGRAAGSEPEVRAMMRFLDRTKPALIASVHQPLHAVGRNHKTPGFVDRLARRLDLPARDLGVGTPGGRISPTLTGWYNDRHPGGAVTVEYGARPSDRYVTHTAAHGLMHSVLAHW